SATVVPVQLCKRPQKLRFKQRVLSEPAEDANPPHTLRPLLRPRRERPHNDPAAENRDELASSHAITSPTRGTSVGGCACDTHGTTRMPRVSTMMSPMALSRMVGSSQIHVRADRG